MDLKKELLDFSKNIKTIQKYLKNRETVKHSLVVPLFRLLGWDVHHPGEFMPGYVFENPGEGALAACDFAVQKNDQPVMFVQVYFGDEDPAGGQAMLAELCRLVPGDKVAILTDGTRWRFFGDSEPGTLDDEPYLTIDLAAVTTPEEVAPIEFYQKDMFSPAPILGNLRLSAYEKKIADYFVAQRDGETADADLISFIVQRIYGSMPPKPAFDKLSLWVRNAFAANAPKNGVKPIAPSKKKDTGPAPAPLPEAELEELEVIAPVKKGAPPLASIDLEALPDADEKTMEARLTVISGDDQNKTVSIQKKEFIVGRNLDLDLVLTDPSVSRRHFKIWLEKGRYWVQDLGSGNKIKVNGAKSPEKRRLENDDLIQAGNTTLRFEAYL